MSIMFGSAPKYSVGRGMGAYGPQDTVGASNNMYAPNGAVNGMYEAGGMSGLGGSSGMYGAAEGGMALGGMVMPALAVGQAFLAMDKENRDRKLASETQRYSPWTQLRALPIEHANPVGDVAQGYQSYLGQNQKNEQLQMQKEWQKAAIQAMNRGQTPTPGPWGGVSQPQSQMQPAESQIPMANKNYWMKQLNGGN